ncbi:MAG: hypothetical protein P8R46_04065 [Planctomycetota bacterium]|nr:hypothetical protein [Planctomycetota bacterium]
MSTQPYLRGLALASLVVCAAASSAGESGRLDPKDGPDVDLRIAVEDDEVRFQIITNLAFLDETTEAYREDESTLDPSEAPAAMDALVELFRRDIKVKVDGATVAPLAPDPERDFEYDQGDPSLIPHFVNFGARAVARTRLTLRYPCKSPPDRVSIIWSTYPDNVTLADDEGIAPPIEILCRLAAGGVDRIVRFQREEPQFIWHRAAEEDGARMAPVPPIRQQERGPLPAAGLGLFGAALAAFVLGPARLRRAATGPLLLLSVAFLGVQLAGRGVDLPSDAEAVSVFEPLHENIYRAFDYTDESDVYDALAESVDGPLLERLYDEVYRSLVLQEAGGAVSRVSSVRHLDLAVEEIGVVGERALPGFVVDATWQVDGAVYHWGHAHTRTNEYRARYTVHAAEQGWRIAASEVLAQRRVDAAPLSDVDMAGAGRFGDRATPGEEELPDEF